ncbi:Uncharacterized protein related to capsule biosynthesis enzymes [Kluyvera cryocrescens]|uniref:Uncharacterized protein related to capsule biosynthesis enzymes n=1 Tax=Kluyvera cryocrescens TaxID=580 RepID=A0A485CSA9_KLUCR|nr:Uncharacterized protein related to capsule biosynthesis enzymes [Kluyvera cryocrescens]
MNTQKCAPLKPSTRNACAVVRLIRRKRHGFRYRTGKPRLPVKRFDRHDGLRVPMQSLAAFTGANYQLAGSLDYVNFLRATQICTNDVREKARAFARVVFNVIFNNRDDHPKNFAYLMAENGSGRWRPHLM